MFKYSSAVCAVIVAMTPLEANASSIILDRENQNGVIVWRTQKDAREGSVLRGSGAQAAAIAPLVACVVEPRTLAILVRDYGYFKSVVVNGGNYVGCRGYVLPGDIGK